MNRNTGLAIVHIAKKELGMDTVEYRGFLQEHTGKNSAADLNPVQMRQIIRAFEERGFHLKSTENSRSAIYSHRKPGCRETADTKSLIRVIKKLWRQVSRGVDEQASIRRFVFKYCRPKSELEDLELYELKDIFERLRGYVSHGFEIR